MDDVSLEQAVASCPSLEHVSDCRHLLVSGPRFDHSEAAMLQRQRQHEELESTWTEMSSSRSLNRRDMWDICVQLNFLRGYFACCLTKQDTDIWMNILHAVSNNELGDFVALLPYEDTCSVVNVDANDGDFRVDWANTVDDYLPFPPPRRLMLANMLSNKSDFRFVKRVQEFKICVGTSDFTNVDDLTRIVGKLCQLGVTSNMLYYPLRADLLFEIKQGAIFYKIGGDHRVEKIF